MVDIDTHRIIDLLDSRETQDVTKWLKTYENLRVVSRDGSVTYKSAVHQTNGDIIQVSDRFHLVKGITDYAKKYITNMTPANIGILLEDLGIAENQDNNYFSKTISEDLPTKEHNENLKRKIDLVNQVRQLSEEGYKITAIAKEIGLSYGTVKKYKEPNFDPINGTYNTKINSKIKAYEKDITEMLKKGHTFKEIETVIRQKGYNGAVSTIRMYATRERKLLKEAQNGRTESVEKIERKKIVRLLYKPLGEIKGLTEEQLNKVYEQYPKIKELFGIVKCFKEVLFSKQAEKLDEWLVCAEQLEIEGITSFVNGIKNDIDAVKKAIEETYNNGLAEGSVNKIKVIKRIMYGRNSFSLLKGKVLRLELKKKTN